MRLETAVPIGRGATGEVLKAWDPDLGRWVALKMLRRDDPATAARMAREARAQAQVDHPNVCKVYDVGEVGGRPYIAMELIEGEPLDEAAAGLSIEERVRLIATVADAVEAAHAAGLIHRDLKPSNILVSRDDDGAPKPYVVDFGLARERAAPGLTETGQVLGTPGFMAPEQVRGDTALDRRCDVYGLGAVLYALLAERPPFEGESAVEVLMQVLAAEPAPLRRLAPAVPRDLETVAMRCLDPDPDRRYPSARALAKDLRRYLDGEPIEGRRIGLFPRWLRRARRHRALTALAAAALVAVAVLAGLALEARHSASERARAAQRFGQEIERLDAESRLAYTAPLHDIRPARQAVEERLDRVAAEAERLGDAAAGPGAYALGRGALALGRYGEARGHFERALTLGHDEPEVSLSLGQTLGEIYQQELAAVEAIRNTARRERRRQELQRTLRDRALELLRRAEGAWGVSPRLVEARIALFEERIDDSIRLAREAAQALPWLYEAHITEARAQRQRGISRRQVGDYEGARQAYVAAVAAQDRAADIGRSDPRLHLARCTDAALLVEIEAETGGDLEAATEAQIGACDDALAADPDLSLAYAGKAQAYWRRAFYRVRHGGDPLPPLARQIELAEKAAEVDPHSPQAFRMLGEGWRIHADLDRLSGRDPQEHAERAIAAFERATTLRPRWASALTGLGAVLAIVAQYQVVRGEGGAETCDRAIAAYRQAVAVDPKILGAHQNLMNVLYLRGQALAAAGDDPLPSYLEGLEAGGRAVELNERSSLTRVNRSMVLLAIAQHRARRGEPVDESIRTALDDLARAGEVNPDEPGTYFNRAIAHQFAAEQNLHRGVDPSPALDAAEEAQRTGLSIHTTWGGGWGTLGSLYLLRAEWALRQGGDPRPWLPEARRHQRHCLELNPQNLECRTQLARTYTVEAGGDLAAGRPTDGALAAAREHLSGDAGDDLERTLARAEVALVEARAARTPAAATAAAREGERILAPVLERYPSWPRAAGLSAAFEALDPPPTA